ncbi:unnamed protein product [Fraxinus pennsylvanica]|uniref:Uncharacterized protein n=1 Tax=Fraxinus pennsylvanica TaxID=56036 RepID=A0AAD2A5G8_9LAMI|nr:unnamed protein product [Fraxinus pennsylvanica]
MLEMEPAFISSLFEAEDIFTMSGSKHLSLSLLPEEGDDEVGDVINVGQTMRRERRGPLCEPEPLPSPPNLYSGSLPFVAPPLGSAPKRRLLASPSAFLPGTPCLTASSGVQLR